MVRCKPTIKLPLRLVIERRIRLLLAVVRSPSRLFASCCLSGNRSAALFAALVCRPEGHQDFYVLMTNLDEFDVFMDAVNRRISMKMMVSFLSLRAQYAPLIFHIQIDTANASDGRQYILITPQDMNNIHIGTTVRVHRMRDPERGQNTLAFNAA